MPDMKGWFRNTLTQCVVGNKLNLCTPNGMTQQHMDAVSVEGVSVLVWTGRCTPPFQSPLYIELELVYCWNLSQVYNIQV